LQARIGKHEVFAGLAKCGWSVAWEWRSHDLATRNPSRPPAAYFYRLLCDAPSLAPKGIKQSALLSLKTEIYPPYTFKGSKKYNEY
jgi:hypothetical protein